MAVKIPEALVKFAIDISVNPANVLKILRDLRQLVGDALELELPLCENVKENGVEDVPAAVAVEKEEPAVVVAEM